MEENFIYLSRDGGFSFSCGPEIPCFNECCRDLNQHLDPYDVLRLKNHLGLSASEFIAKYTREHTGPETGLPVLTFATNPQDGWKCPFVTDSGCSVYEARPGACRLYPLMRLVSRNRDTGKITEHFALLREHHCQGLNEKRAWTPNRWIKDQDAATYNEMNDLFMEVLSLKNIHKPGPLNLKDGRLFHMACYDIDSFRQWLLEKKLMKRVETMSDTELLKFGFEWMKKEWLGG